MINSLIRDKNGTLTDPAMLLNRLMCLELLASIETVSNDIYYLSYSMFITFIRLNGITLKYSTRSEVCSDKYFSDFSRYIYMYFECFHRVTRKCFS